VAGSNARRTSGSALPAATTPAQRRDQRLRQAILRFEGCLSLMPRTERRVVELRAGVDVGHPRTRSQVARMTGLSTKRVRRLERRGLLRLERLGRQGRCGVATGQAPAYPSVAGSSAVTSASTDGRAEVRGERRSGVNPEGSAPGKDSQPSLPVLKALTTGPGTRSLDLTILLVVLAVLGFLAVVAYDVRRT
jgi:sigma-70-like protein